MHRILAFAALFYAYGALSTASYAVDLYSVPGVAVDVTAESATVARDRALAQGRPIAWQRLFRKLTPPAAWPSQPQLDDSQLQRIVRSFDVANERRSTTRYIAEVTYHFIQNDVQRILRQAGIAFAENQSRPVLVIPQIAGRGFEPDSAWARAWTVPSIAQGLVPVVLPEGGGGFLSESNLAERSWSEFAPLVRKYSATGVVVAVATPEGNTVQITEITSSGRNTSTLTFARSSFAAAAEGAAQKISESWKARAAIDFSQRGRLVADVSFGAGEWPRIRQRLRQVRSIADVEIQGFSAREARVALVYFGRADQLRDALAQQSIDFREDGGGYTLALGADDVPPIP